MTAARFVARLRLPAGGERTAVLAAAVAWLGAAAGLRYGLVGLVLVPAVLLGRRRRVLAVVLVASVVSGTMAGARTAAVATAWVPAGIVEFDARVVRDPISTQFGTRLVVSPTVLRSAGNATSWRGPPLGVFTTSPLVAAAGETVTVVGRIRRVPAKVRGTVVAGDVTGTVTAAAGSAPLVLRPGNALRARVSDQLAGSDERGAALMAGLLVGDTSGLTDDEMDDLRRAGLAHFVAVSGGNVALFLAGWWLVLLPLGLGARSRAAAGLAGLVVFVVATRWEPSVVRAAAMAALVLGGRIGGIVVGPWLGLGGAVTAVLLVAGDLALNLGFQLSVLATAGVLAGAGAFAGRWPAPAWTVLGATLAAQLAVLPLLLLRIGSVPLISPLTNLCAAPLVTLATILGGIGVVGGATGVTAAGVTVADWILRISAAAAAWPQLGLGEAVLALALGALALVGRLRRVVALVVVVTVVALVPRPAPWPTVPTATFLDVGQGDATLLRDPAGAAVLIDGGADPVLLRRRLGESGVGRLDVVIATHGDLDHVGGLVGLPGVLEVGAVWAPPFGPRSGSLDALLTGAAAAEIDIAFPPTGTTTRVGAFHIEVVGPRRRYAAENDGSLVLWIEARGSSLLVAGDIGTVAQRELPTLRPDVLLVPHHGAATTDLAWLAATVGGDAVLSVGPNRFGHPAPEVVETLTGLGVRVRSTQIEGSIEVPFGDPGVTGALYSRDDVGHPHHQRSSRDGARRARAHAGESACVPRRGGGRRDDARRRTRSGERRGRC